jgi:integral membrane protein (TIGR00529 family)
MTALSGYLVRPRLRLIFFPALIGLLPMPGGAIFSAPMVKAVSADMRLGNEDRVVINYWFRHVWEMAWPLYPGIILTVALADISITALISRSWPGIVSMFGIGWFFFLRAGVLNTLVVQEESSHSKGGRSTVLREGLPLLIAIVGAIGLESMLSRFTPDISFEWGVIVALIGAIICIMLQNQLGMDFLLTVLKKKTLWTMLMVIAAIFIFKDVMQAAGIVQAMAASAGGGVALFAAAVFLPFLVGMVAGINVAFVGATFPLLIGLLHSLGMEEHLVPYLILGSFSGFTGVMISPIHICFVLTCNYFETDLGRAWRRIIAPSICFGLSGALLFWFLL